MGALAVCAIPSYGLAKNKNKIAELGHQEDIADTALKALGDLAQEREQIENLNVSLKAQQNNKDAAQSQSDVFTNKTAQAADMAPRIQEEKEELQKQINS